MSRKNVEYHARLFRGWEIVQLDYALEGEQVILRRKSTWKPAQEQRVEVASLTGEVRRVWGRQPAFVVMTVIVLAALLVLGIDAMMHGVGAGGGLKGIYWPLWGPLLLVVVVAGFIRAKTRRAAEWTHFLGSGQGAGVYILKDRRNLQAHDQFVDTLKRRVGK
jgi:hypothetical protein